MEEDDCEKIGIPEELKPKSYYSGFNSSNSQNIIEDWSPYCDTANLDIFYGSILISNEIHIIDCDESVSHVFLERVPILKHSVFGGIYLKEEMIYTFVANYSSLGLDRFLQLSSHGDTEIKIKYMTVNLNTGEIIMSWSEPPGNFKLIVSYETSRL